MNNDNVIGKTFTLRNSAYKYVPHDAEYGEVGSILAGASISVTGNSAPTVIVIGWSGGYYSWDTQRDEYDYVEYAIIPPIKGVMQVESEFSRSQSNFALLPSFTVMNGAPVTTSQYMNLYIYRDKVCVGSEITNSNSAENPILSISGNTVTATFNAYVEGRFTTSESKDSYLGIGVYY